MLKKWFARAILALGLGTMMLGGSSAQAGFTIADLIAGTYTGAGASNGGTGITIDGMQFTNFSYTPNVSGSGIAPPSTSVTVTAESGTLGGTSYDGLRFNAGWFAGANSSVDTFIQYDVTVLSGPLISDLHLHFNGVSVGSGHSDVADTFSNSTDEVNSKLLYVYNDPSVIPSTRVVDSTTLVTPVDHLTAGKDVLLYTGSNGFASISSINQDYTRQSRHVPEPASFALVGLGMLATGFAAYRRRKMAQ